MDGVAQVRVVVDTAVWLDQAGSGVGGGLLWHLMQQGRLIPVISFAVYRECERKFWELTEETAGGRRISEEHCRALLAGYLRMAEYWDDPPASGLPVCDDNDVPFADLLVVSRADALITGDPDLLCFAGDLPLMRLTDFMVRFGFSPASQESGS